ncbi:molybdopterin-containing oxidoreductase family protein [Novosphingobium lentum]|uniref:molybdopterin-containing oxidoreductase family protein n=1 Tax=Novosphingobium lentum TaxID=145287 RepID=UPI0008354ED9|nr:molybdopterin-dependent oxidoreductase [Novosphingobium lentum]
MQLTIDQHDRIVDIRGDREHPLTRGYACFKGLQAEEAHHGPARLLHPLRKNDQGEFARIASEAALDEIAQQIEQSIERYGPDSVGVYFGNGSIFNSTAVSMQASFLDAIGSRSRFTSYTIDQSAKTLSFERLGGWAGGNLQLEQCDVILLIGTNPLLSHGLLGFLASDPTKRLKQAKAAGLKLIVIDPRRTETAGFADLAIQPLPGNDSAILAAMIRIILDEGWEDKAFCERYVGAEAMRKLRTAVEPFDDASVEASSGLERGDLRSVAAMFARDSVQGAAYTGTGPSMAPHSNLMQHLADCLNVVCGRFIRAGDRVLSVDMMTPPATFRAEVIPPSRTSWNAPPSRIRGVGSLAGEKTTGTLPDEILTPGAGQVRVLISCGGNLASLMPDQQKMLRAFEALDLKVSIDPYMSNTVRLADYVIPPLMQYERADLPVSAYGFAFFPESWVGYSPAILQPPQGSDVMEEWYFFWAIAKRLGKSLNFCGTALDRDVPPTTDELLAIRCNHPLAPLDEIKRHPSGKVFTEAQTIVQPPRPEATATFDVMPDDVFEELAAVAAGIARTRLAASEVSPFTHLLSTRRMRNFYNSIGMHLAGTRNRNPYNPAYLNPADLAEMGLASGDHVTISSDHASIEAIVEADSAVRPGVVSMAVAWGGLPGENLDPALHGSSTNMLITTDRHADPLNAMPRMSAIPVNIAPQAVKRPWPANAS